MQPTQGKRRLPLAAWVLLGAFGVAALTCGAGVAWLVSSERGQQFMESAGHAAKVFGAAAQAPGTEALRALGCKHAAVLQASDLIDSLQRLGMQTPPADEPQLSQEMRMVICQGGMFGGELPSCDEIARTYAGAVEPSDSFAVAAQRQGAREPHCHGLYGPDGTPIVEHPDEAR